MLLEGVAKSQMCTRRHDPLADSSREGANPSIFRPIQVFCGGRPQENGPHGAKCVNSSVGG